MFLVITSISRSLSRMGVCVAFAVSHILVTYFLRKKFLRHGFPGWVDTLGLRLSPSVSELLAVQKVHASTGEHGRLPACSDFSPA